MKMLLSNKLIQVNSEWGGLQHMTWVICCIGVAVTCFSAKPVFGLEYASMCRFLRLIYFAI